MERDLHDLDVSTLISYPALVEALTAAGLAAEVYHSGGGVMTIGIGPTIRDSRNDERYSLLMGPSGYGADGIVYGSPSDFYVGPDDDGDEPASHSVVVRTNDIPTIVGYAAEITRRRAAGTPDLSDMTGF